MASKPNLYPKIGKELFWIKEILNDLIQIIELPEKSPEYAIRPEIGILLFGPPGTGKTLLVETLAEKLSRNLIKIDAEINSSADVKKSFDEARKKARSIIFLDEMDTYAPIRKADSPHISKSIVGELLRQIGQPEKLINIVIIGTTNHLDRIDPALLRLGRFDHRIYIPLPSVEYRKEMFTVLLQDKPHDRNINYGQLAELSEYYSFQEISKVIDEASKTAAKRSKKNGKRSKIEMQDLLDWLGAIHPQTGPAEILQHDRLRRQYEFKISRGPGPITYQKTLRIVRRLLDGIELEEYLSCEGIAKVLQSLTELEVRAICSKAVIQAQKRLGSVYDEVLLTKADVEDAFTIILKEPKQPSEMPKGTLFDLKIIDKKNIPYIL